MSYYVGKQWNPNNTILEEIFNKYSSPNTQTNWYSVLYVIANKWDHLYEKWVEMQDPEPLVSRSGEEQWSDPRPSFAMGDCYPVRFGESTEKTKRSHFRWQFHGLLDKYKTEFDALR